MKFPPTLHALCLAGCCLLPAFSDCTAQGQQSGSLSGRILVITGEDYPGHKWRETTPVLLAELSKDQRLTVDVLSDLKSLAATKLDVYDAVVLHFKNDDPQIPGQAGLDNLRQHVRRGGGLVLLHFACGAFEESREQFAPLAGRVWFGMDPPPGRHQHDPHGRFQVNITEVDHPITKGLSDFETTDELYTCLVGDLPITTLATAVSKIDQKTYPLAFVLQSGEGRVFHCVLGHDAEALSGRDPAKLIRRGCAWAAGLVPVAPN